MNAAIAGLVLVVVVAVAADFRLFNALICLFKSLSGHAMGQQSKGTNK